MLAAGSDVARRLRLDTFLSGGGTDATLSLPPLPALTPAGISGKGGTVSSPPSSSFLRQNDSRRRADLVLPSVAGRSVDEGDVPAGGVGGSGDDACDSGEREYDEDGWTDRPLMFLPPAPASDAARALVPPLRLIVPEVDRLPDPTWSLSDELAPPCQMGQGLASSAKGVTALRPGMGYWRKEIEIRTESVGSPN